MDNKLSELSKPVAWTDERGNLCTNRNKERGLESRYHQDYEKYTTPFYSQEYVSALLTELERYKQYAKERDAENESLALTVGRLRVELEAKDEVLREIAFRVSAGGYNSDSVEAEVFKQKIIDGINSISGVLIKRIDELEAVKADASQVFKEIGYELGCNPDNESIMMAIDDLKVPKGGE
ncbi:ead/Ea22-like family protein [Serratia marcescens]|uniref:ead/Ea22-like family protein n=1 Tax=Serratia marcescens TaxID=615 RepID=UPI003F7CF227